MNEIKCQAIETMNELHRTMSPSPKNGHKTGGKS